jgi:hypothetical protein
VFETGDDDDIEKEEQEEEEEKDEDQRFIFWGSTRRCDRSINEHLKMSKVKRSICQLCPLPSPRYRLCAKFGELWNV